MVTRTNDDSPQVTRVSVATRAPVTRAPVNQRGPLTTGALLTTGAQVNTRPSNCRISYFLIQLTLIPVTTCPNDLHKYLHHRPKIPTSCSSWDEIESEPYFKLKRKWISKINLLSFDLTIGSNNKITVTIMVYVKKHKSHVLHDIHAKCMCQSWKKASLNWIYASQCFKRNLFMIF